MPSEDKKNKKSKKHKLPADEVEEEPATSQEVDEPVEDHEVEQPEKKKKKKKKQQVEEEPEEEQANEETAASQEDDEDDELVIHNKGGKQNGSTNGSSGNDAGLKKALKQIEDVSEEVAEEFKSAVEQLSQEHDNDLTGPMASALAVLSGATKSKGSSGGGDGKSLLTDRDGYTTYILTKNDGEIRGKSFAFSIVKRMLGEEEGDAAISHITFTADKLVISIYFIFFQLFNKLFFLNLRAWYLIYRADMTRQSKSNGMTPRA